MAEGATPRKACNARHVEWMPEDIEAGESKGDGNPDAHVASTTGGTTEDSCMMDSVGRRAFAPLDDDEGSPLKGMNRLRSGRRRCATAS